MLTSVSLSASALRHNLAQFRALLPEKTKLATVLKSNAYGHGFAETASVVAPLSDVLAVVDGTEALHLRALGHTGRILVLSILDETLLPELITAGIELPVYDLGTAERVGVVAEAVGVSARIHLKIDTGASRIGVLSQDVPGFLQALCAFSGLTLVGAFSHFADAEDPACVYTAGQIRLFEAALSGSGADGLERHMACTAAILLSETSRFDLVRLGLGLYGLWPSDEVKKAFQAVHPEFVLKPVLSWTTRILQVKDLAVGTHIGYGCSYTTTRETRLAVLPVGYWDGFDRGFSNNGTVLIQGEHCPVLGRVCMNLTMVDVTDVPQVKPGDAVMLLGSQGHETLSAEDLAVALSTINYEVVTRINPLVPRVLVD